MFPLGKPDAATGLNAAWRTQAFTICWHGRGSGLQCHVDKPAGECQECYLTNSIKCTVDKRYKAL